jgi:cell division septal protein FtsQ
MKYRHVFFKIIPIAFAVFFLFAGIILWNIFKIKKVKIQSQKFNIKGINIINNLNYILIDENKLRTTLLAQNREVEDLKISKEFPDNLVITPLFRLPEAVINYNKDVSYLIDKDAIIISKNDKELGLPVIKAEGIDIFSSPKPDWRIVKAVNYIKKLEDKSIPAKSVIIEKDTDMYKIDLIGGEKAIIPQINNAALVSDSLQIIVSRFRIEGKFAGLIDFTSDKPVVTLSNGEKNYSKQ